MIFLIALIKYCIYKFIPKQVKIRACLHLGLFQLQFLSDIVTSTLWQKSDIVTIFPISNTNFSTVALLPCDYLLDIVDIVIILPCPEGSHNIK